MDTVGKYVVLALDKVDFVKLFRRVLTTSGFWVQRCWFQMSHAWWSWLFWEGHQCGDIPRGYKTSDHFSESCSKMQRILLTGKRILSSLSWSWEYENIVDKETKVKNTFSYNFYSHFNLFAAKKELSARKQNERPAQRS